MTRPTPGTQAEATYWVGIYDDAIEKVLQGQEYSIGTRHLTRANLESLQTERKQWVARLRAFQQRGGLRVFNVIPRG